MCALYLHTKVQRIAKAGAHIEVFICESFIMVSGEIKGAIEYLG